MAGYKNFVAGEEALATDVNGYLMGQTVARFTNAAQRAAAITAPALNQLTMLNDRPGYVQYWNGSAWVDQAYVPPTPAPDVAHLLFQRIVSIDIGSPGSATYDLGFTMPRNGSLLLGANMQIGMTTTGGPPNTIRATLDNAACSPQATAVMPADGELSNLYGSTNLAMRAYWGGINQGTTVFVRLLAQNLGGPGVVNWNQLSGLFTCGSNITTI